MKDNLQKAVPYLGGLVIAFVVYLFPEMKPFACGAGFALPFMVSG